MTMKKKIVSLIAACGVMSAIAITASARYINWNVTLPKLGGNVDTKSRTLSHATNLTIFLW